MNKLFSKKLWIPLASVCAVLLVAVIIGGNVAQYYVAQINSYFNCKTYDIIDEVIDEDADTQYYKPMFETFDGEADKDALYLYDKQIARNAAAEGAVLLWNNGALPIADNSKTINFYGARSVNYYYVIGGSGGTRMSETITLKTAFENARYTVNDTLCSSYASRGISGGADMINEVAFTDDYASCTNGGYGIYVIGRKAGEGGDMATSGSDGENGNVLALSANEISHLDKLVDMKKSGKLEKLIVLLNTVSGALQFDKLAEYKDDIDACMWVGLGGTSGPDAVADLVSGAVTPSGRLSDTFVYNAFSAPSTENLGDYDYTGTAAFENDDVYKKLLRAQGNTDSTEKNLKYIVYREGIYVGYKYYETRYEDCVLDQGNASASVGVKNGAGAWSYSDEVFYPFGYGISYTTFEHSDFNVKESKTAYTVSVKVKNIGKEYSGKDVVQVYLQKPYTDYDKTNNVEQASVNLVGFGKTKILAPNESEVVEIVVDKNELKSYDANNAESYIIDEGTYYLTAANNAHDAVNNILKAKGKTGDAEGDAAFVKSYKISGDYGKSVSQYTGQTITNRFDDADLNKAGYGTSGVTYLSRKDWQGTYPQKYDLALTAALLKALDYGKDFEDDEFDVLPEYGQINGLNLFALWKDINGNDIPYDHEMWDKLLDQMTFAEQTMLLCNMWCATAAVVSVNAPGTENRDGPSGLNYLPAPPVIGLGMCYPSENLTASSFNYSIAYDIGECLGEDNLACGFTFLYAPGANIHRTPFSGRNGEYYCEDGFLSGIMCEWEVKGLQSNGSGAQIKHFALNDQEVNRNGVAVWANEQSIRELYLKAFEFACVPERGGALSVMSGFNRVGAVWSGAHYGMMTDVLRTEWGFLGFVQSDGNGYALMSNYIDGLRAGNDSFMCGGGDKCLDKYKDSTTIALAMRESCHRVLYAVSRTHAMNGSTATSRIVLLTPWWQIVITAMIIVFAVLTAVSASMLAASVAIGVKRKKAGKSADTDVNDTGETDNEN